jgi:hypothetical protein
MANLPSLFVVLCCVHLLNAAFTLPTSYTENVVQETANKTWCYYPAAGQTRDVSCTGDFTMVSQVHLNTTTSIGYYAPDNSRYGGAEWPVPQVNPGRVTLCVSGRAQDGSYQTACMFVTADNSLPISGGCWIAVAQKTVTDGCYVPGQLPYTTSSSLPFDATSTPGSSFTPSFTPSATSPSQPIGKPRGEHYGLSYLI